MLTKLEAAEGGDYDIVIGSDFVVNIARNEGLIMEIDKEKVPNFSNLNPAYLNHYFDPEAKYTVPYVAGTPLIVYDPAKDHLRESPATTACGIPALRISSS